MRIEGVGCVVGVKFRPGGFYPFVRQSVGQWTNRAVPAEVVFESAEQSCSSWARDVWGEAATCSGDDVAHADVLSTHFDALLEARQPVRDAIAEDVSDLVALIAERKVHRVSDLVRVSGRSERTLHRLFLRYVGVSPGWVIRRCRLRGAAARLKACHSADVSAVAWEFGYADQAHLIRDFRATIGVTPGAYVRAGL
jgi:AraC-like DNA-binding protein